MKKPGKKIVVVGAGGNIGSHLVPHLGRMAGVNSVTLIDRDFYEKRNLLSQNIRPKDMGKPKAAVQAQRLREINPALQVDEISDSVQNIPLGRLRAEVILACLDSRTARQFVNQAAWRLGVPWIDTGVLGECLYARVNVYMPGPTAPCLECGWDEQDYAALEQAFPCQGGSDRAAPTNAPSSLGALAAALQAIECQKLLAGKLEQLAVGRQVLIDASYHKHFVTALRRNPQCRFDHEVLAIREVGCGPKKLTILKVLDFAGKRGVNGGPISLRADGQVFVSRLTCSSCRQTRTLMRLYGRLSPSDRICECGQPMAAAGFDMLDTVDLTRNMLRRSLNSLGFKPGDVLTIGGPSGESHYEIGG